MVSLPRTHWSLQSPRTLASIQLSCRSPHVKRLLLFVIFFTAVLSHPASAEKRVALVVGNSAYRNVARLDNPDNDAVLVARTLRDLGFALIGGDARTNLDKRALDEAVQAFGREMQGADVAMFYYAGHGVQVRGANYLVPIDANPTREADVDFQMLDVNVVLNQMQGSGTRLNMIILDACRNNPFGGRGLRAAVGGLAQLQAPDGTLISYATQPGNVAQDGDDGHSPYTRALAATLKRPGLDLFGTFNQVGLAVKRATGGAQQPWVSSSPIDGSFYFLEFDAARARDGYRDDASRRRPRRAGPPVQGVFRHFRGHCQRLRPPGRQSRRSATAEGDGRRETRRDPDRAGARGLQPSNAPISGCCPLHLSGRACRAGSERLRDRKAAL